MVFPLSVPADQERQRIGDAEIAEVRQEREVLDVRQQVREVHVASSGYCASAGSTPVASEAIHYSSAANTPDPRDGNHPAALRSHAVRLHYYSGAH
jgi:hypothetical protein